MGPSTSRQIRKLGAIMTLVGFALGVAFSVVAVVSVIDGENIVHIITSLMPVIALGLLFSVSGLALRGYRRQNANHAPLLEIPEEIEELELDYFQREKQKVKSYRNEEEL